MPPIPDKRLMLERMSYYADQAGILSRYLREEDNWRSHIEQCHRFILESLNIIRPTKIMVLGSGHLLEFPVNEVLKVCEKVILVDIIHPPHVKKFAAADSRIELIEADITGGMIEEAWNFSQLRRKKREPEILLKSRLTFKVDNEDGLLVVSLNILSQLNTLLEEYLVDKELIPEREIMPLSAAIQESHLRLLMQHDSVLITDTEEISQKAGVIERVNKLVFHELPEGIKNSTWEWDFDTTGSYRTNTITKLRVFASLRKKE